MESLVTIAGNYVVTMTLNGVALVAVADITVIASTPVSSASSVVISSGTTFEAGSAFNISVIIKDEFGNPTPNPDDGSTPAEYLSLRWAGPEVHSSRLDAIAGAASGYELDGSLTLAGEYVLTVIFAASADVGAIGGSANTLTVIPAIYDVTTSSNRLVTPTTIAADAEIVVEITCLDAFGNPTTNGIAAMTAVLNHTDSPAGADATNFPMLAAADPPRPIYSGVAMISPRRRRRRPPARTSSSTGRPAVKHSQPGRSPCL